MNVVAAVSSQAVLALLERRMKAKRSNKLGQREMASNNTVSIGLHQRAEQHAVLHMENWFPTDDTSQVLGSSFDMVLRQTLHNVIEKLGKFWKK